VEAVVAGVGGGVESEPEPDRESVSVSVSVVGKESVEEDGVLGGEAVEADLRRDLAYAASVSSRKAWR
jgi:hypothetical protein